MAADGERFYEIVSSVYYAVLVVVVVSDWILMSCHLHRAAQV